MFRETPVTFSKRFQPLIIIVVNMMMMTILDVE